MRVQRSIIVLCRNPFLNQVIFEGTGESRINAISIGSQSLLKSGHFRAGLFEGLISAPRRTWSQSLLKSGHFRAAEEAAEKLLGTTMSQSLLKSGHFREGAPVTSEQVDAGRNPFLNQVIFEKIIDFHLP